MEVFAYLIAVLIGISLGLIGGGGSILTVPVLVYLLHVDPLIATTYSLFIVGVTSLVGGAKAYGKKLIDFRAVALFGIPSILSIFIARHYILPAIPDHILHVGNFEVIKGMLLMIVFAVLMFAAAFSMISHDHSHGFNASANDRLEDSGVKDQETIMLARGDRKFSDRSFIDDQSRNHDHNNHEPNLFLVLPGLLIGLLTGLLGAGGGFLIIPTLVLIIRMPMKIAVGTSLLIVAINSLFGFVFSLSQYALDWELLLIFSALAIVGIMIGSRWSDRIPAQTLKKTFGWFIMIMGVYILIKELWL